MEFCIFEEANNSKATKPCANLLNNCKKIRAQNNSIKKTCFALFKSENKIKLVEKINAQLCSSLKLDPL